MALRTALLFVLFAGSAVAHPMRTIFEKAAALDDGTLTHLVYADWLDENDDPDRAEFLRNQVALAAMAPGDGNREAVERRGAELLHANYVNWIPTIPGVVGIELRGGLVDSVIAVSVEYTDAIRAAFPSARSVRVLAEVYRLAPNPLMPLERAHLESATIWLRRHRAGVPLNTQGTVNALAAADTCATLLQRLARLL